MRKSSDNMTVQEKQTAAINAANDHEGRGIRDISPPLHRLSVKSSAEIKAEILLGEKNKGQPTKEELRAEQYRVSRDIFIFFGFLNVLCYVFQKIPFFSLPTIGNFSYFWYIYGVSAACLFSLSLKDLILKKNFELFKFFMMFLSIPLIIDIEYYLLSLSYPFDFVHIEKDIISGFVSLQLISVEYFLPVYKFFGRIFSFVVGIF